MAVECQELLQQLQRFETRIFELRLGSIAQAAFGFMQQQLQPHYVSLLICEPGSEERQLLTFSDSDEGEVATGSFSSAGPAGLIETALTRGEMVYRADLSAERHAGDSLVRGLPADIRSLVILPLRTRDAVIGTLNVGSERPDGIPPQQRAFLAAAATGLAASLRSAQRFEKLEAECERLRKECDFQKSALKKSHDELELEVARRTAEIQRLQERLLAENTYLKEELAGTHAYGEIIGDSPSLKSILARVELVAPTDASVLILGESGTGKELIAREIRRRSRRAERPLIKVNCATIPRELYESEFFGHIKGAFTSAISDRIGRFEAADDATLFLDEVGEIPPGLQGKLLRVLQEGEFERVGEGRTRRVDVRIIAATNKNLAQEVKAGRFREDLYYRLNVFPIEIPPLRERKEDIHLLADHLVGVLCRRLNRPVPRLTEANLMDLKSHDWPGNVRELQNVIERALILAPRGRLRFDLPRIDGSVTAVSRNVLQDSDAPAPTILTEAEIKALQKRNMLAALIQSEWRLYGPRGAAQLLGMKPTTLIERMRRLRIKRPA